LLTGKAALYHSRPVVTSSFSPTTVDGAGFSAQMQRSIWASGGQLQFGWRTDVTDQTITGISFPGSSEPIQTGTPRLYENSFSLSYTQPLLRNYKGKLDRLEYELAEYDEILANLQALENEENFLLRLATGFIDWALLMERRSIAEERLRLAEDERELTTSMQQANLVEQVDVLRSEDAVRLATQNLVLVNSQARAKRAELAVLAAMPGLWEREPDYDLYKLRELPSTDEATRSIEQNSRALLLLKSRAQQLERLGMGYRESGKPSINADLGLTLKGGDEAFANSLELSKPDVLLGVSLSHFMGAGAARSAVAETDLELSRIDAEIRLVRLELESQMQSLLIQLSDLIDVLDLNKDQIESAREKTAEERRLYEQGRSELNFVIQAEDNERNARLTYAENAAGFHRLYHRYLALTDLLLPTD
jgi:outer membrane protein TolC